MNFKKRLTKTFLIFVGIFLLLFLFRFAYGFMPRPDYSGGPLGFANSFTESAADYAGNYDTPRPVINRTIQNIASSKYEYKKSAAPSKPAVAVDQKFEKVAQLSCHSDNFTEDEAELRQTIDAQHGIIQFQNQSGTEQDGNRSLTLQVGVPPDAFETFVDALRQKLEVVSISITKTDKTTEFRELNAQRATLLNTRQSLSDLKAKGGNIEEYVQLENRILEIDEKLQNLGVQLGNYDAENEFCTVQLLLSEREEQRISVGFRIKVALEWTIEYYVLGMLGLFFALGAAFVLLLVVDKLRGMANFKGD